MLLRGGDQRLEVLLVRRTPDARFMGGAWVFPGGSVQPDDEAGADELESVLRLTARRELREEAGVTLDPATELVSFARWITPPEVRIRFDTWFFLAPAPHDCRPVPDGSEIVGYRWSTPGQALAACERGELQLVFPTIRQLEQLGAFRSATALLEHARGREIVPVEPRIIGSGEQARIVLPGESGYASPPAGAGGH
jgi:8-oxo-dGTP pyrophosphatase MutT (NUDIX family)